MMKNSNLLRLADLSNIGINTRVFAKPDLYGNVLARHAGQAVIGWDDGHINSFLEKRHQVYLAPLCWVENLPVYAGDILYAHEGIIVERVISRVEEYDVIMQGGVRKAKLRVYSEDGFWDPPEKLTWAAAVRIEGRIARVGDTLFSRDGDKVIVKEILQGHVTTTPGQIFGKNCWTPDYLCWEDPTILFNVRGRPVRVGDVLYGTWKGADEKGYEVTDDRGKYRPMSGGGLVTVNINKLTWEDLLQFLNINGHVITAPNRAPLTEGTKYYVPHLPDGTSVYYIWSSRNVDYHFLNSGLVHLTDEAAAAHAQALISLSK